MSRFEMNCRVTNLGVCYSVFTVFVEWIKCTCRYDEMKQKLNYASLQQSDFKNVLTAFQIISAHLVLFYYYIITILVFSS